MMFDEQEIKYLQNMEDRILEQSAANMRMMIENVLGPQFNLIFEKLDAMEAKLIPQEAMDIHEDRLEVLETTVRQHSREIAQLKKAQ